MTTPLNIIENLLDHTTPFNRFHIDGKDYYHCWYIYHTFDGYPEHQLTEENLEKMRQLVKTIVYPALQLHSLGLDYLWDRKKKEYIPFKKYAVSLKVTEVQNKKVLTMLLECYKAGFTYRSMNHLRRFKTLAKERMRKIEKAVELFNLEASVIF